MHGTTCQQIVFYNSFQQLKSNKFKFADLIKYPLFWASSKLDESVLIIEVVQKMTLIDLEWKWSIIWLALGNLLVSKMKLLNPVSHPESTFTAPIY